jgi:hypothetical protein
LGGDVDGTCLAVGMVAGKGSFQGGEGMRAVADVSEDLAEVNSRGCFKEIVCYGF